MGVFCNMCALQGCRIWCVRTLGEGGARARCVLGVRLGAARRASREHMAGARPCGAGWAPRPPTAGAAAGAAITKK